MRTRLSVMMLLAACLSGRTPGQARASRPAVIEPILAHLDDLASRSQTVTMKSVATRLEGRREHGGEDLPESITRMLADRSAANEAQVERQSPTFLCGVACSVDAEGLPADQPALLYYWTEGRGVLIDGNLLAASLTDRYEGFGRSAWPHDFLGYSAGLPLSVHVRYALARSTLRVTTVEASRCVVRMPYTPRLDATPNTGTALEDSPCLELEFVLKPAPVLCRRSYLDSWRAPRARLTAEVAEWSSTDAAASPAKVRLRATFARTDQLHLSDVCYVAWEWTLTVARDSELSLDGRTAMDIFQRMDRWTVFDQSHVSPDGMEMRILEAAIVMRGPDAPPEWSASIHAAFTGKVASGANEAKDRIARTGREWPSLRTWQTRTGIDLRGKYCSQAAIALLGQLAGRSCRFTDLVAEYPAGILDLATVQQALAKIGIPCDAVHAADLADRPLDVPFLALRGEGTREPMHLAVLCRQSDGRRYRMWSAPDTASWLDHGRLGRVSPRDLFLIPTEVAIKKKTGSLALGWSLLGCGAVVMLILLWRRHPRAGLLIPCLVALVGYGCGAATAQAAPLEVPVQPTRVEVQLHVPRTFSVPIRNVGTGPIHIVPLGSGCGCLRFASNTPSALEAGQSALLEAVATLGSPGTRHESLTLLVRDHGREQVLKVPVTVACAGTELRLRPEVPVIRGSAGSTVRAAFEVEYVGEPPQQGEVLHVTCDDISIAFQARPGVEAGSSPRLFVVDCLLSAGAREQPVVRLLSLQLKRLRGSECVGTVERTVLLGVE